MDENIERAVGRIEGKLDIVLDNQSLFVVQVSTLGARMSELEQRVSKWEQRAVGALAVVGVLGAGIMWAINWIASILRA